MASLHIKAGPTLKGQTQFVTLNMTLGNGSTSDESWDEAVLRANPEIMNFHAKGKIVFVTEAQYAAERKAVAQAAVEAEKLDAALDSDTVTDISDALETDNPSVTEARKLAQDIRSSLNKLEALLSGNTGAKRSQPASKAGKAPQPELSDKGDGLDLPMSAPPGLKPQAVTEQYLRKTAADKRKYLKECRDIGLLRDIAMHEPDAKMKLVARKAAKGAEQSAEEASRMSEAAA